MSEIGLPWDAYAATLVRVQLADRWVTAVPSVGEHTPFDTTWHVITAWNPDSRAFEPEENDARNEELRDALRGAGHDVAEAAGEAIDGSWPPEPSFAVRSISTAEAVEFGRRFGQAAIFRIDPDGLQVVDCQSGDSVSSTSYVVLNEDGLLDPVPEGEDDWLRRDDDDPLRGAMHFVGDVVASRHIVWPACRDGKLVPPPWAHILDKLVRGSLATGESPEWDAEWELRPSASTLFFRRDLTQTCDICPVPGRPARYDGYTRSGAAANMCGWCYQRRSTLRLGVGEGQFALRFSEVPAALWRAYERAISVWRERGAPTHKFDVAAYEVAVPDRLGPPFDYAPAPEGAAEAAVAFHELLSSAEVQPDPAKGMFPENLSEEARGLVFWSKPHPADGVTQNVVLGERATAALDRVVQAIAAKADAQVRSLPHELRLAVSRQAAQVLLEGKRVSKAIGQLESNVAGYLGPTIVVLPVRGLEWNGPPRQFGDDFLIGTIGADFHAALDEMSDRAGVARFQLEGGPRWTEDYEHSLEDPTSYADLENPFHPIAVAQRVDAAAAVAVELTFQKLRAVFGAIQVAHALDGGTAWTRPSPTISEDPPAPEDDEAHDGYTFTFFTLERDAPHERQHSGSIPGEPVEFDELLSSVTGSIVATVASWSPRDADRDSFESRIVACAKHFHAASNADDLDFTAMHFAAALEALLVRRDEKKRGTLARRASRLLASEPESTAVLEKEIGRLYDLRSEAAHLGLSTSALVDRASVVRTFVEHVPQILQHAVEAFTTGVAYDLWLAELDTGPAEDEHESG